MTAPFQIPKNMNRYLKRLSMEYRRNKLDDLATVLESSKFTINEKTSYDNWDSGMDGHDLVLYVPEDFMGLIPLDGQQDTLSKLREDLNKAASAASDEYVNAVHFEYLDEDDPIISSASSLSTPPTSPEVISRLWSTNCIKLFISHRDTHKAEAYKLAENLTEYGVSSFVAHDSIEPDEEWQSEIEKALQSMDLLLVFITEDLFDSAWTNQEIGFALGKKVPIVSIKLGTKDPVGFISKKQAIKGHPDNVAENAVKIWETIEKRLGEKPIFNQALINRFVTADTFRRAKDRFNLIAKRTNLKEDEVEVLVEAYNTNDQISGSYGLRDGNWFLNVINLNSSKTYHYSDGKVVVLPPKEYESFDLTDEIPF